jgi:hypothetical protein
VSVSATSAVMTPGMAVISLCGNDKSYNNGCNVNRRDSCSGSDSNGDSGLTIAAQHGNSERKTLV